MKPKKLSKSKVPASFFTVKSEPLPRITKERLKKAAEAANERIAENNNIYRSSNSHANSYPVMSNSSYSSLTSPDQDTENSQSKNPVKMLKK